MHKAHLITQPPVGTQGPLPAHFYPQQVLPLGQQWTQESQAGGAGRKAEAVGQRARRYILCSWPQAQPGCLLQPARKLPGLWSQGSKHLAGRCLHLPLKQRGQVSSEKGEDKGGRKEASSAPHPSPQKPLTKANETPFISARLFNWK